MNDGQENTGGRFRKGDIVRLKSNFNQTLEAIAARRAGLPLREECLYQILNLERGDIGVVLTLSEVRVFHLGGLKHVTKVSSETFPYVAERFELIYPA